jgi:hypothetical protein
MAAVDQSARRDAFRRAAARSVAGASLSTTLRASARVRSSGGCLSSTGTIDRGMRFVGFPPATS